VQALSDIDATTTSTAATLLLSKALLALVPARVDGVDHVVVAAHDGDAVLVLDDHGTALLRRSARNSSRVFVFDDAKATQRWLLARGVDVLRPVCRLTLETLTRNDTMWGGADVDVVASALPTARGRAVRLLDGLEALLQKLDDNGHKKVARLECLVTRAFAAMEARGLPIDVDRWRSLVDEEKQKAAAAKAKVLELAGDHIPRDLFGVAELNLDSEADVRALLVRVTGQALETTSKFTLATLQHPLADAVLAWREPQKIVTTYGDAFLAFAADRPALPDDEGRHIARIRSTFVPLGASTGRVACREPNLQNLPKDQRFHDALRAPAGRVLVTADYATCELRIVAELAEDPVFIAAFDRGDDLHSTVATSMFGVPVSKTENSELRQRAKAINFGLVYGMGPGALASSLGVDRAAGEELLARYFKTFPRIRDYLDGAVETALRKGYSETVLGRRLVYDRSVVTGENARGELSRIMKNMPIQGTSADMTKLAMLRIHERLTPPRLDGGTSDAGLVNTVHDELVVECRADDADRVSSLVRDEMEGAHRTLLRRVPPVVEVHVGPVWHH
jgi:DNA polymerase-1